jgi:GT2 family glycosyltransferase
MMVRKQLFRQTGGFDESLRVAFNYVDFCLRLRARGLAIVVTPHALLYHRQSASRRALHPREDVEVMSNRWRKELERDPFYNPNLSLRHADYRLCV